LIFTKTRSVILKALWIIAFGISSIWFLYWIGYDVFVWNKVLSQVLPQNYFGLIMSIVLIILGTQLGKIGIFEKLTLLTKQGVQKKRTKKPQQVQQVQQVLQGERIQPSEQVQQTQPAKEEEKQIPEGASVPPGCRFYLGYLYRRPKSVEIPEECLECGYVVDCLSPTARNIEEHAR
jgi:hypothetical protein